MKAILIIVLIFAAGFILGAGIERESKISEKHKLVMLLKKGNSIDTVKIEVDTFKYYEQK